MTSAFGFLPIARSLIRLHLRGKPAPLLALWNITFRCNLHCPYCGACDAPHAELDTDEVRSGLDALWKAGVRWITFGGGEPLMRADMIDIVQYARKKGFRAYLSTNGFLLEQHKQLLDHVDHINLSLDGGQELHERIRGKGTFERVLAAARLCRAKKVPASFMCVLSSHNVDRPGDALAIAEREGFPISFQPATLHLNSSAQANPLAPPVDRYREAIAGLISRKRQGAPIRNSLTGLRHLARWPEPTPLWCNAAVISVAVEPTGQVIACHHHNITQFLEAPPETGVPTKERLRLKQPKGCVHCWCSNLVELGLIFSLRWEPIYNAWRYDRA